MSEAVIRFSVSEDIGYVCLNTPPANTLTRGSFDALHALWSAEIQRSRVCGVVIQGSGRHFSSGADIEELQSLIADARQECPAFIERNMRTLLSIERCALPVVAAIGGCCLGAGLELALACHYRVCATNATLGLPESSFGLMPGCGGTIRLPALVGRAAAMRMILDAQSVRAEEARAMGLVDVVVHKRELTRSAAALIRSASRRCA